MSKPPTRRIVVAIAGATALLAAVAMWRAFVLAWLCDDAFISIRYAANLADGIGLVYNAGEYVEGYTNLAWTLALAGFARLGASPVVTAQYLGLPCYAALAALLVAWSRSRARSGAVPFLPLAAGLVMASNDFHVWATGGLETMLFTALASAGILLVRWPGATRGHAAAAGGILALLVLTRLDGLLFAAAAVASYWLPGSRLAPRERRLRGFAVAAPVAVTLAALAAWKLAYYGELLPTAFYAKSVLQPYFSQGLMYVGLFLVRNWFLAAAAIALLALRAGGRRGPAAAGDGPFFVGTALVYLLYVVEVGGDFMYARRVIPVVPLLLVALEAGVARLPGAGPRLALATALLAAAALPLPLFAEDALGIAGVVDERRVYPKEKQAARELQGRTLAAALAVSDARVAFEGGMCVFGYYSGLPYLAELTGLTQYSLARSPLGERGRVGHEKQPDARWFADNRIHFVVRRDLPPLTRPVDPNAIDEIRFGDVARATILLYSDAVMDPLRGRPGVHFTPIETAIARAERQIQSNPLPAAEQAFAHLQRYYFDAAGERGKPAADRLRALLVKKRAASIARQRSSQG